MPSFRDLKKKKQTFSKVEEGKIDFFHAYTHTHSSLFSFTQSQNIIEGFLGQFVSFQYNIRLGFLGKYYFIVLALRFDMAIVVYKNHIYF